MTSLESFYRGKTVLLTGHTGFKGSWMAIWLHSMGAKVVGYALDPITDRDNFVSSKIGEKIEADIRADIRDTRKLSETFDKYNPDIVFHLAAQPLVRLSYECPVDTYEINVMGTINIMEQVRRCSNTKVAVLITTDKCYENKEQLWGYREDEPMGGYDPYSSSKGAAEIAISSWRRSFFNPDEYSKHQKSIASARAGNVIGGGDWSKDRIIPDCIKAIEAEKVIEVRSPKAVRPWQHVLEPLGGYLLLASKMWENPTAYAQGWNFGPQADSIITVWEMTQRLVNIFGKGVVKDVSSKTEQPHEATLLSLDISKARYKLGWIPKWNIEQTLEYTAQWYMEYKKNDVYELCVDQIKKYCQV